MTPGVWTVLLVFFRFSGMLVTLPLFKNSALPRTFRVGLAVVLTPLIAPLTPTVQAVPGSAPGLLVGVLWELMIGGAMGWVFLFVVSACGGAGAMMDLQCGLANSTILNPGADTGSQTLLSTLMETLALLCLLQSDAHLIAVEALARSLRWSPVGMVGEGYAALGGMIYSLMMGYFGALLSILFPVLFGMLCVEVALAFLSRLMPSLNMLTTAAPLRVLIGLFLVTVSLPLITSEIDALMIKTLGLLGA